MVSDDEGLEGQRRPAEEDVEVDAEGVGGQLGLDAADQEVMSSPVEKPVRRDR
jgi:hypothetical protein